jgi:hypothetical protein
MFSGPSPAGVMKNSAWLPVGRGQLLGMFARHGPAQGIYQGVTAPIL